MYAYSVVQEKGEKFATVAPDKWSETQGKWSN